MPPMPQPLADSTPEGSPLFVRLIQVVVCSPQPAAYARGRPSRLPSRLCKAAPAVVQRLKRRRDRALRIHLPSHPDPADLRNRTLAASDANRSIETWHLSSTPALRSEFGHP